MISQDESPVVPWFFSCNNIYQEHLSLYCSFAWLTLAQCQNTGSQWIMPKVNTGHLVKIVMRIPLLSTRAFFREAPRFTAAHCTGHLPIWKKKRHVASVASLDHRNFRGFFGRHIDCHRSVAFGGKNSHLDEFHAPRNSPWKISH